MTRRGSTESSRIYMTDLRGYLPTFISNFLQNIRVRPLLDKINFNSKNMDNYKQKIAPYKIHQPEILFVLSEHKKEGTPPELFVSGG